MVKRWSERLRYRTKRGTILDWERAGFPGLFILATGSDQHVCINRREEGTGFLIVHDLLLDVVHQPEPTFDDVCRWSMTRFTGVQYGWWQVRRFGKARKIAVRRRLFGFCCGQPR